MGLLSVFKMIVSLLYQLWGNLSDKDKEKIKKEIKNMIEKLIRTYYRQYKKRQSNSGEGEAK